MVFPIATAFLTVKEEMLLSKLQMKSASVMNTWKNYLLLWNNGTIHNGPG